MYFFRIGAEKRTAINPVMVNNVFAEMPVPVALGARCRAEGSEWNERRLPADDGAGKSRTPKACSARAAQQTRQTTQHQKANRNQETGRDVGQDACDVGTWINSRSTLQNCH